MLVLTRKLLEKVYIGEDICVTIVRLEGGQVRLGIDAPRAIPVIRAELRDRANSKRTRVDSEDRLTSRLCAILESDIRPRAPSR